MRVRVRVSVTGRVMRVRVRVRDTDWYHMLRLQAYRLLFNPSASGPRVRGLGWLGGLGLGLGVLGWLG